MKLIEELENLLVKEIVDKTWQPKKLAKKINALYQEKINDLKRENIKLKYRDSSKEFCTYRGDSCWAKEPNCECKTFENCKYKITEVEFRLKELE